MSHLGSNQVVHPALLQAWIDRAHKAESERDTALVEIGCLQVSLEAARKEILTMVSLYDITSDDLNALQAAVAQAVALLHTDVTNEVTIKALEVLR